MTDTQDNPMGAVPTPRASHGGTGQAALSLLMLAILVGGVLAVDLYGRHRREVDFRRDLAVYHRKADALFDVVLDFESHEDRLALNDLLFDDYSKGGVYLLGGSNATVSLMTWELEEPLPRLIHNYGFAAATHAQQLQLLRYLVEERGLLAAGGEKTMVVLGLFYASAVQVEGKPGWDRFFAKKFTRYGLYSYDPNGGLHAVPMPELERLARIERIRCANCMRNTWRSIFSPRKVRGNLRQARPRDLEAYGKFWQDYVGADWEQGQAVQQAALAEMIDYLQARGVTVKAVLTPLASWQRQLPYVEPYNRDVKQICRARDVELLDLTDLLGDEQFADSAHPNYAGQQKIHPILLELAMDHLRRRGLLPRAATTVGSRDTSAR